MKKIVVIFVIIWVDLCCFMVTAQETCINNIEINDSLSLSISNCNLYKVPREFLKYSNLYTNVTVFAGLVFNDSIYHDRTELKLKKVEVYALGFQDPKDTMTLGDLIVMHDYLGELPCGWTNSKRYRFLKKSSKQLSHIFQKGNFILFFEKQQSTPFFIGTICITLIERL